MSLQERQPKVLEFIKKQRDHNKVSHAYLLVGENDTAAVAYHIAQSLLCKAAGCGVCETCTRIQNHDHGDFIFVSGKDKIIKKEAVLEIKSRFLQTSLEDVPYKIYVIEDVDNASLVAMNSFLKFLEEPESDIIAILTTSKINRVLDTIKSRCMILNLEKPQPIDLENALVQEGFDKNVAHVLSYLSASLKEAKAIDLNPMFHKVYDTFHEIRAYYERKSYDEAGIFIQVQAIKEHKFDLESIRWFTQMHVVHYREDLSNLDLVKVALKIHDRIRPGVISSMLIDQFAYELNQIGKQ